MAGQQPDAERNGHHTAPSDGQLIKDEEDPAGIVATLRDALPAGSYLALSHGTLDFHPPANADQAAAGYKNATAPLVLRGHEQVSPFFDGFDLVEPGLVQAPLWRPDGKRPRPRDLEKLGIYAGVGRKGGASTVGSVNP